MSAARVVTLENVSLAVGRTYSLRGEPVVARDFWKSNDWGQWIVAYDYEHGFGFVPATELKEIE